MSESRRFILSPENLSWAWRKARRQFAQSDILTDPGGVAAFELNLERELDRIAHQFDKLTYRLQPLRHVPQPKKSGSHGEERLRQSFHVAVRDQVAWLAVVNAIGPSLDARMPHWSYGHRLYKAAWYEDKEGESHLELGPYRHSTGHLYRKFKHSWPLYRRHISMTARYMASGLGSEIDLDDAERAALSHDDKPDYLLRSYWPASEHSRLFHTLFDLEKFYPRTKQRAVKDALSLYLDGFNDDVWLQALVARLLRFRVSREGSCLLGDRVVQPVTYAGRFHGIPTGLMVAGFLANVAMLPLDEVVQNELKRRKTIAHFRFVDDHAVLAKDFDSLVDWIDTYQRNLARLEIGPQIAEEKYEPAGMAKVIRSPTDNKTRADVAKEAELDGSRPAKLMTKTLALVSDLAGMDFDVLAEPVREQRLAEIEWLLTADLPEHEIRGDTRTAFAAGRLSTLIPIAHSPPHALLDASREWARLRTAEGPLSEYDEAAKEVAKLRLAAERDSDVKRRREQAARYFKLIFQAFCDHPEKSRMFVRLLDYCRSTGHDGINSVLTWAVEKKLDEDPKSSHYYGALALQTLARHIATAAADTINDELLSRQRFVARRFLGSVSKLQTAATIHRLIAAERERHDCDIANASAFSAAVALAGHLSSRRPEKALIRRLEKLRLAIAAPSIADGSATWIARTGRPLGVWTHLLDRWCASAPAEVGVYWPLTAPHLDPEIRLDLLNLRKGGAALPPKAVTYLSEPGSPVLKLSDAGWLFELGPSKGWRRGSRTGRAGQRLRTYARERHRRPGLINSIEWIAHLKTISEYDPRRSEWTALELVRQLLEKVRRSGRLEDLDELHPANVLLPIAWLNDYPPEELHQAGWTWEAWRYVIRRTRDPITLTDRKIADFRRAPPMGEAMPEQEWDGRLRGCGLLLLGLASHDFNLPSLWNVRGLERDLAGHVRQQLEDFPLSSRSLAIVESALLPRSVETRFMMLFGRVFFGAHRPVSITDTTTGPPVVRDVEELHALIEQAQKVLERNQISVLDHAARQLIPMNLLQMTHVAVELPPEDGQ